jgi:uncharacterized protein
MAGQYHEPREKLSSKTLDIKRAIDSMMEELEAVDWYRQRAEGATDPELRAVLDHHQREEVEHFAMLLEWVRRRDVDFDAQLRTYLFSKGDILQVEEADTGNGGGGGDEAGEGERHAPAHRESRRKTIGRLEEEK